MIESENPAYDKLYLADVMEVHRYLFTLMEKNGVRHFFNDRQLYAAFSYPCKNGSGQLERPE